MNGWTAVRGALILLFAVMSLLAPLGPVAEPPMGWGGILAVALFTPVALLLVMGFQAFNPFSAKTWRQPSWRLSPFNIREPLQFFHVVAYTLLASGIVTVLRVGLWAGPFYPEAVMPLAGSVGLFLGLRLTMVAYRAKMTPEGTTRAERAT